MASQSGGILTNLILFAPLVAVPVLAITGIPSAPSVSASSSVEATLTSSSPTDTGTVSGASARAPGGGLFDAVTNAGEVMALTGSTEPHGAAGSQHPGTHSHDGQDSLLGRAVSSLPAESQETAGTAWQGYDQAHAAQDSFPADQPASRGRGNDLAAGNSQGEPHQFLEGGRSSAELVPTEFNTGAAEATTTSQQPSGINWSDEGQFDPRRELLETSGTEPRTPRQPAAGLDSEAVAFHDDAASQPFAGNLDTSPADFAADSAPAVHQLPDNSIFADSSQPANTSRAAAGGSRQPNDAGREFSARTRQDETLPFTPQGGRSAAPVSWTDAVRRLNDLGIHRFQLQPGNRAESFHFSCLHTPRNNPRVTHRFEAEAGEPLAAVQLVLEQIEQWQQQQ